MNNRQFGPCLANYGTRFRLWAPAAKRVEVMLEQPHAMKRGEGGWFTADIAGVKAGARYKFRIDDEIDVPDPASAFQPDDVFGPRLDGAGGGNDMLRQSRMPGGTGRGQSAAW